MVPDIYGGCSNKTEVSVLCDVNRENAALPDKDPTATGMIQVLVLSEVFGSSQGLFCWLSAFVFYEKISPSTRKLK